MTTFWNTNLTNQGNWPQPSFVHTHGPHTVMSVSLSCISRVTRQEAFQIAPSVSDSHAIQGTLGIPCDDSPFVKPSETCAFTICIRFRLCTFTISTLNVSYGRGTDTLSLVRARSRTDRRATRWCQSSLTSRTAAESRCGYLFHCGAQEVAQSDFIAIGHLPE